jgi:uncharacterized membrane protein
MEAELTKPIIYGVVALFVLIVWQLIASLVSKRVDAGYITQAQYQKDQDKLDELKREVRNSTGRIITAITIIAVKAQVPVDDIKDLFKQE